MALGRSARHSDSVTRTPLLPAQARVVDLTAHRRRRVEALTRAAAAPVLHITPEFLAALNGRDAEPVERASRGHLRAV
jgi:hypothetical protein